MRILLHHILLGTALVSVTVVLHTLAMNGVMDYAERRISRYETEQRYLVRSLFYIGVIIRILLAHFLEMALWGLAFFCLGFLPDAYTAYYFAQDTYTTLGYG